MAEPGQSGSVPGLSTESDDVDPNVVAHNGDDVDPNVVDPNGDDCEAGGARSDDEISMLGSDPLFLVMSEFFMTKKGKNIADILEEISNSLKDLQVAKKGKLPFK